jgi:hypothetical protein
MSSYLHELLILLFRNRSGAALELLREIDLPLPEYDEVRVESSDLGNVRPAEYRADLVLLLERSAHNALGIIVEVQLACDEDKPYVWPAYIANLRARHRCPVCLLVITVDDRVARWAGRPIELGPGTRCQPWVVGPSNAPAVTDLQDATENVELAVLSAIEHAQSTDAALAARVASAAIVASAGIDAERWGMYLDVILFSLSKSTPGVLGVDMNALGYEYLSDFARRYVAEGRTEGKAEGRVEGKAEGRTEGKAEGRVEMVLKLLVLRFGSLSDFAQTRIRTARDAELDAVAERILTAQTLEEALGQLG